MNVLITGSANGLGLATAKYFADNNHIVYSCDIVKSQPYNNIKSYELDVTNIHQLNNLKQLFEIESVNFDLIINFAGIYNIGSFLEKDLLKIKQIIDVNLLGAINVNQTFYPLLTNKGKIIIITSELASLDPLPFNGLYSVSKIALDAYAQSLRQELNLKGQKVITVRPGAFNTNLSKGSLEATKKLVEETTLYQKQSKKFLKIVEMFMGTPKKPEILSKYIYKVSLKKHPRYIYTKNRNIGLGILGKLPKKLQCFIIKIILK